MRSRRKVFIGAAWPYANGQLHLGHIAGCLLPADIFARYCRLRGYETLFVSGSDMHGTPIMVTADKMGKTPEEVANSNHVSILKTIELMRISYDNYTSTHTKNHFDVVQDIFRTLLEKGFVDRKVEEAPYCRKCGRFMPDRYIEGICPKCEYPEARGDQCDNCGHVLDPKDLGSPRCKLCGSPPVFKETEHFYLLLSKLEGEIREFAESCDERWRPNTRKSTDNFFQMGLKDRPITRDLQWGVPIPVEGFDDKRIYVWFEAVCGYLSASKEHSKKQGNPDLWESYWKDPECRHYYFLAKDNIPFHTIIWPAILMGYGGLNLPYDVPANEYLQWDGSQFSKSKGHGTTVNNFLKDYPAEPLRFYLSTNMPESRDSNFDLDEFIQKNNTELLGALGNYLHRVVTFIHNNYGEVPKRGPLSDEDREILRVAEEKYRAALDAMELVHLKEGLSHMIALVNDANRYFNNRAPWKLVKVDREQCGTVLSVALQLGRTIAYGMYPYIPASMNGWCGSLGIETPEESTWETGLEPVSEGLKIGRPEPIFDKLEKMEDDDLEENKGETVKEPPIEKGTEGIVTFDRFMELDLRVGRILEVSEHPDADRLYVIKVELGENEPRQLVAGLKKYYDPRDMVDKKIIVVTNLKPAMMRGVESRGMLLAAENGDVVSLLTVDRDIPPGSRIH
ncbi:MAG: methionine--tRNA ligase [Thermoplasmatota archaeon]